MPRFFVENFGAGAPEIVGEDARHIIKSLRMKVGETLTVCDTQGSDYFCKIANISDGRVELSVTEVSGSVSEPSVEVTLFQCMPKGDKLENVIQKSIELGVSEIVPVLSSRCVSRPDEKSMRKKLERYSKIADSAAKQSGRGILPAVRPMIRFSDMTALFKNYDRALFFYEGGGCQLSDTISRNMRKIAIVIGPEGGFDIAEAESAVERGAVAVGLGKRILRTETAPLAALSCVMLLTGNLE